MKTETLGTRLRKLRLAASLSTHEAAEGIGVSASTYREWENGRGIRGEPYEKIANTFGVTITEVLLGDKASKSKAIQELEKTEAHLKLLRQELFRAV
ncbi:MAG: helix-turn-helix transcriptional regulator [Bdellovibrionaceae bacterium]|nr:helix-turn-helix transcriptional regulator [Pseudobdellovibrionaceae bacterium]